MFDVPAGVQSSRQELPPGSRPDLYLRLTNREIDEYIEEVDAAAETTYKGPFSVLDLSTSASSSATTSTATSPSETSLGYALPYRSRGRSDDGTPESDDIDTSWSELELVERDVPEQLSPINLPSHESELLEHFVHFVTGQMSPQPTYGKHKNIIATLALVGSMGAASEPHATAAIFHGVCAASALSLASFRPDSRSYILSSMSHEDLALSHLRRSIEGGATAYVPIIIAVTTLLFLEHLGNRGNSYRPHLQAGMRSMMLCLNSHQKFDRTVEAICEQWLLRGALGNIAPASIQRVLREAMGQGTGSLEEHIGMNLPLLDAIICLNETLELAPAARLASAERLRALFVKAQRESLQRPVTALVWQAAWLHFQRGVCRIPAEDVEILLEEALYYLFMQQTTGKTTNECAVALAACTIGSECESADQRSRFLEWCNTRSLHEQGNIHAIISLVKAMWHVRAIDPRFKDILW